MRCVNGHIEYISGELAALQLMAKSFHTGDLNGGGDSEVGEGLRLYESSPLLAVKLSAPRFGFVDAYFASTDPTNDDNK